MLKAIEYLGKVGVGITSPEFFRANDGNVYVVKRANNRIGTGVLISELLSTHFGKKLGLIFPPSDLITLGDFLPQEKSLPDRHFASLYIAKCRYATAENIIAAGNFQQIAGIILFDHMFHNADRTNNRKNMLLCTEAKPPTIYAIDNSHLFRTGRWTITSLKKLSEQIKAYPNYLYGVLLKKHLHADDFAPYLALIKGLSDEEIQQTLSELPEEWFGDASIKPALFDFITRRRSLIDLIYNEILKRIPKKNGGYAVISISQQSISAVKT